MTSSLSNLVDNLAEGTHKIKCTNCNTYCFEYKISKDGLIEYKCLYYNKSYKRNFDENLRKRLDDINDKWYKFANHNINKFILFILLILYKGIYTYEYIDDWEKFNETLLPEKEDFYSHLNTEDITHADYNHVKGVHKDFKIKLSQYHDLYVQSDYIVHYC